MERRGVWPKLGRMRRLLVLAVTSPMLAAAPAAQAAVTESLSVSVQPTRAGTTLRPAKSDIQLDASISDPTGARLPPTDRLLLDLDRNIRLNGKYFPSCSAEKLDAGKRGDLPACRGAVIGASVSSAKFYDTAGRPSGSIDFKVTLFNGPAGKSQIAFVEVPGTSVKKAMVGTITRGTGPFGLRVTYVIPPQLKEPLPGVFPSLDRFRLLRLSATTKTAKRVKVGSRTIRRKVGYVESIGCTGGRFHDRVAFDLATPAPTVSNAGTLPCRR